MSISLGAKHQINFSFSSCVTVITNKDDGHLPDINPSLAIATVASVCAKRVWQFQGKADS